MAQVLPKAVAMARKLRRIDSTIAIEDVVADVNATNIAGLIADADVVLDGTDNFATRYLTTPRWRQVGQAVGLLRRVGHLRHEYDHPAGGDALSALHHGRAASPWHCAHV